MVHTRCHLSHASVKVNISVGKLSLRNDSTLKNPTNVSWQHHLCAWTLWTLPAKATLWILDVTKDQVCINSNQLDHTAADVCCSVKF